MYWPWRYCTGADNGIFNNKSDPPNSKDRCNHKCYENRQSHDSLTSRLRNLKLCFQTENQKTKQSDGINCGEWFIITPSNLPVQRLLIRLLNFLLWLRQCNGHSQDIWTNEICLSEFTQWKILLSDLFNEIRDLIGFPLLEHAHMNILHLFILNQTLHSFFH